MARMPLAPGAYMDIDKGIWLLETTQFGMRWRLPGGTLVYPSAFVSGPFAKVAEAAMPFRRMAPIKRRT